MKFLNEVELSYTCCNVVGPVYKNAELSHDTQSRGKNRCNNIVALKVIGYMPLVSEVNA